MILAKARPGGNSVMPLIRELMPGLGPQDMVVANNFLCHMAPADAEKCLRNIEQLVSPGGYLLFQESMFERRSHLTSAGNR